MALRWEISLLLGNNEKDKKNPTIIVFLLFWLCCALFTRRLRRGTFPDKQEVYGRCPVNLRGECRWTGVFCITVWVVCLVHSLVALLIRAFGALSHSLWQWNTWQFFVARISSIFRSWKLLCGHINLCMFSPFCFLHFPSINQQNLQNIIF